MWQYFLALLMRGKSPIPSHDNVTVEGSFLFGAVLFAAGIIFASFTGIITQLFTTARGGEGCSFIGLLVLSSVYVESLWWPVIVVVILSVGLYILMDFTPVFASIIVAILFGVVGLIGFHKRDLQG